MTISGRKGHWRTNAAGTRFWVSEHSVERVEYTLSKRGSENYVNGHRLLETRCTYCYEKVYFVSSSKQKNVFFNTSLEPLTRHNCRKSSEITSDKTELKRTKKFLDENNAKALDRRASELKAQKEEQKALQRKKSYSAELSQLYSKVTTSSRSIKSLKKEFQTPHQLHLLKVVTEEVFYKVSLFTRDHKANPRPAAQIMKTLRTPKHLLHNLQIILGPENEQNLPATDSVPSLKNLNDVLENAIFQLLEEHENIKRINQIKRSEERKQNRKRRLEKLANAKVASENLQIEIKQKKNLKRKP